MLITIGITLIIFTDILMYLIIFDVILSWLTLVGINFRPKFLNDTIDPLYSFVNRFIPTTIGPFKFDAFIVIVLLYLFQAFLFMSIPGLQEEIYKITNSI